MLHRKRVEVPRHMKYLQPGVDQAWQADIDLVEGTGQVDIDLAVDIE